MQYACPILEEGPVKFPNIIALRIAPCIYKFYVLMLCQRLEILLCMIWLNV